MALRRWWNELSGIEKCMTICAVPPAVVFMVGVASDWPYAMPAILSEFVFVPLGALGWFVYRIRKGEAALAQVGSLLLVLLFCALSFGLTIAYLVYLIQSGQFGAPEQ